MELLDELIEMLRKEVDDQHKIKIPKESKEKRKLLRGLMNVRTPRDIPDGFLELQDEFLKKEAIGKGIVKVEDIPTIKDTINSKVPYANKIAIWQGDITRLQVDAIVNAANAKLLGCFAPCHGCIDNAIHSSAGMELREECNRIMKMQGYDEPTGKAKITRGYNLPCKYVIHTVGPIVLDILTVDLCKELTSCYRSCLQSAIEKEIRSIAFCCISTGEFRFPNDEAARIAVNTVQEFLRSDNNAFDKIIFNVFKPIDKELYEKLLRG